MGIDEKKAVVWRLVQILWLEQNVRVGGGRIRNDASHLEICRVGGSNDTQMPKC